MKNLDITAFGVEAMSKQEQQKENGGTGYAPDPDAPIFPSLEDLLNPDPTWKPTMFW